MQKKPLILIPAHLDSQRVPGKLLREWKGKPLFLHTYDQCIKTGIETVVISNNKEAFFDKNGGCLNTRWDFLSVKDAENGTDRCSKFLLSTKYNDILLNYSMIINVQADEVEINPEHIHALAEFAEKKAAPVSTLYSDWGNYRSEGDVALIPNMEKNEAIWFQRQNDRMKWPRSGFKHLGVYAYSLHFLEQYPSLRKGIIETETNLEQFRVLENGMKIGALQVDSPESIAINTEDDYKSLLERP